MCALMCALLKLPRSVKPAPAMLADIFLTSVSSLPGCIEVPESGSTG